MVGNRSKKSRVVLQFRLDEVVRGFIAHSRGDETSFEDRLISGRNEGLSEE